jgi:hypothetical protein
MRGDIEFLFILLYEKHGLCMNAACLDRFRARPTREGPMNRISKSSAGKSKSSGPKKKLPLSKKPPVPRGILASLGNETTLPTERDATFLQSTPLTPPVTDRLIHSVVDAFTGRVVATLQRAEVIAFFGKRVKVDQIATDAELALEAMGVAQRLSHGAERAHQIAQAPLARLMEQASRIVRDAHELTAEHPGLADGLKSLTDWWSATFPGGGPRSKGDVPSHAPVPAAANAAIRVSVAI